MKKDDPMSCINTDTHSQQQQAVAGYGASSYGYQELSATSTTWRGSPDYSSDDGGRSDEDNDPGTLIEKTISLTSVGGNLGSGVSFGSTTVGTASSGNVCKDQSLPSSSCGQPRYMTMSREVMDTSNGNTGTLNSTASIQMPCNVWRKHSTGNPATGLNNFLGTQQHQLMFGSLNQCFQLIWNQQCELTSLRETLHALQQQHSQTQSRHSGGGANSIDNNDTAAAGDHHNNSHSNLGRYTSQHRN
ncbi:uncharacterized protein LOC142327704 isoform X1 [Lycorma delicatula]